MVRNSTDNITSPSTDAKKKKVTGSQSTINAAKDIVNLPATSTLTITAPPLSPLHRLRFKHDLPVMCLLFKVAMRALGFDEKKTEVLRIIRQYDKNDNGKIVFEDFNKVNFDLVSERILNRSPEEEIHRAFQLFDDDNTGKISLFNLKRVAEELGENLDEEDLQAMIDEFDLDEDGEINEQEFMKIMSDDN
ncbi:18940_t:CDS:2 [Acaulospora morrowiae]|uniref:18940_t:CDS:1 n=1 Tax=Acaulospora morrowiae TaxID=94023 RepID=A0A9N9B782_9GLOM|nr:18940_t:CDS:2 [Acaulospora morrowiae]